ncbi:GntR family transcriptional regulator [Breznakia sp. PF5-3]|uniref:GntR family transcriptional regulator n=1 Tax=unclassified Breznakia TaxID=2623764 RepID=UPI00240617F3|nr:MULTISPECIES: GntR family transcriptional regulator [unclassified Breznakia]MDL2276417.1 GntR family transcriptional regulator [Breznakia sp. OttesenSCG-928-G09]MDF9823803.1 GntR family transcriptional regulator [Breznakia sp. PM6-1]MDF9834631.1 GntR family transcriptional regulator [Breznakia sp. PF5-3]MDF9836752.1 GntR family transcriptional regulator [Breznakia sp. PFB2-8]MDF9858799.1 GntR family transcriptional regulator [Breznakia sp. PH5-24]
MKLNHSKEAMPLYLQIKNHLKQKIENKEYKMNDIIPGELELEKIYNVSRITVRQAILELEREGYVSRARGKGTTVIYNDKINEFLFEIKSFTKEMEDRGITPSTKSVEMKKVKANADVAKVFNIKEDDEVFLLHRVRCGNGEPVVIFHTYLNSKYPFPMDKEKYMNSMYDVFDEIGVKTPVRVCETFEAISASAEVAKELEIKEGSPIFFRVRKSYDIYDEIVEYSLCYYPGNKYTYSTELTNRG